MRPSREEVCLEIAIVIAQRSTCSRGQCGVVIAREGRILVTGYNGAPAGMPHCDHDENPDEAGCQTATHAEVNAISWAARYGVRVEGADLFTTIAPCLVCARSIINAGLTRVFAVRYYRDMRGVELLTQAGIPVRAEGYTWRPEYL